MTKPLRIGAYVLVGLMLGLAGAYLFRLPLLITLAQTAGAPPLAEQADVTLGKNERWIDDYYTVEQLDAQTFAISEARYFRDVYMYLLIGEDRALLIDTGSPIRDVSKILPQLTDKPVTVIASHLHFDHTGNHDKFANVLMQDVPAIQNRVTNGTFTPEENEYLGRIENFDIISWPVTGWWKPGTTLDLGNRQLQLLETPGHTPDSLSIWEPARNTLYMGDYTGDGEIYAFMPNTSLQAYLETTDQLIKDLPASIKIYAAHGASDFADAPITSHQNLVDLKAALIAMRDGKANGSGLFPRTYPMNHNTIILTDIPGPDSTVWDFN